MEPILGEIKLFAGTFAPVGWAMCNGAVVAISQYDALYSLIGTTYGGDGVQSFALPDLRGRIIVNQGTGPGLSTYVIGEQAGVDSVTLTSQNMPAHNHPLMASAAPGNAVTTTNNLLAAPVDPTTNNKTVLPYLPDDTSDPTQVVQALLPNSITNAGGSMAHENRMPFICINYIIATVGVFPSRP